MLAWRVGLKVTNRFQVSLTSQVRIFEQRNLLIVAPLGRSVHGWKFMILRRHDVP